MKFLKLGMTMLMVLALTACVDRGGDPADNDSGGTAGMTATGGTPATGGMMASGGTPATGGVPAMGGEPATGGMAGGTMGDGGMMAAGGGMLPVCPEQVVYTGQLQGDDPEVEVPDGGNGVTTPYDMDFKAGIAEVLAAVPAEDGDLELEEGLAINGAVVIATSYYNADFDVSPNQSTFWVADADGAIQLYLDYMVADATPDFQVRTGQKVSFTVTALKNYRGNPQIAAATDWALDSANNDVFMFEPDREFTSGDVHRLVRITGTLTGNGDPCDREGVEKPNRCWDLDYGFGQSAIVRSKSDFVATGGCVTFVGPLNWFNGRPQLYSLNFSWLKTYD